MRAQTQHQIDTASRTLRNAAAVARFVAALAVMIVLAACNHH